MMPTNPSFPGTPATADGSETVVWVETHVTQGACAYPITSSTNMGAGYQTAQASGKKNLWGEPLFFLELESEHSSASTCEGFAPAGGPPPKFYRPPRPPAPGGGRGPPPPGPASVHGGAEGGGGGADAGWGIAFAKSAQEAGDLA